MDAFKIGSVYRCNDGTLVRLEDGAGLPSFLASDYEGTAVGCAVQVLGVIPWGWRRLDNGMLGSAQWNREHAAHLIPGELTQTPSGWVALGAEKQEESDLPELVKNFQQRELRKGDPSPSDVDMIDRDQRPQGTVQGRTEFDPFKGFRVGSNHIWQVGEERADHASPFGIFRSPDCSSDPDHLNASRHQMAGMCNS